MKKTPYKDREGNLIINGMFLNINASPYHGKYQVKFGEYKLTDFTKNDRQVVHCGWYLDNGENKLSLAHVMSQPLGPFPSSHAVVIIN